MELVHLSVEAVTAAEWNSNEMDQAMHSRLRNSILRFGVVMPLVVHPVGTNRYETIGGAQRLAVLKETGVQTVACVVVDADDVEARLLAQALNRIQGEDNLGLRAETIRHILEKLSPRDVLAILPETSESLNALAALNKSDLAEQLRAWQAAQAARLHHFTVQLGQSQLEVVQEALERALAKVTKEDENPNRRGNALVEICRRYLEIAGGE